MRSAAAFAALAAFAAAPPAVAAKAPNACAIAADYCVQNGGGAACRASQASCEAMNAVIGKRGAGGGGRPIVMRKGRYVMPEAPNPAPAPDETPGDPVERVATICAEQARQIVEVRLQGRIERTLVTSHSRVGTVWRADVSTPSEVGPYEQRLVCARGWLTLSPLKMLDPAQSVAPLPAR